MYNAPEVWIQPNRRALGLGAIVPLGLLTAGSVALYIGNQPEAHMLWLVLGGVLLGIGCLALWTLWQMLHQPRVAYQNGEIWLFLQTSEPAVRVPIDIVECFFRGQAEGLLRGANGQDTEVATVIIRVAEVAKEWHHREIKPAFGMWCEGYVTIRGTWCEPITPELLKRLNQRLVEIQRERKQN
jgi:hypothetical protein